VATIGFGMAAYNCLTKMLQLTDCGDKSRPVVAFLANHNIKPAEHNCQNA
jgi:hypothetical protein